MRDGTKRADNFQTSMVMSQKEEAGVRVGGVFHVECLDANGNVKWTEEFNNLVVNQGLQNMNNVYFYYSSTAQTTTWYMGLMNNVTTGVVAGDTLASHTGWGEFTSYGSGNRQAMTWASSTSTDPAVITSSTTSFSITGTGTVEGAFVCSVNSGTGGVLFSAKQFSASRNVVSGDTLNVTYSLSNDAA